MNLIEELYYGAISPSTKICIDNSSYQEAMNMVSRNEEILSALLEGKEKKLFNAMVDAYSTIEGELTVAHFVAGFRLGAGLMAEATPEKIAMYLRE